MDGEVYDRARSGEAPHARDDAAPVPAYEVRLPPLSETGEFSRGAEVMAALHAAQIDASRIEAQKREQATQEETPDNMTRVNLSQRLAAMGALAAPVVGTAKLPDRRSTTELDYAAEAPLLVPQDGPGLLPPAVGDRIPNANYRVGGRKRSLVGASFLAFVCVPTLLCGLYYGLIAKSEYSSEFRFSVIEQTTALPSAAQTPSNSMSGGSSGQSMASVAAAISGTGSGGAGSTQNFIVVDYVQSPGAVDALQKKIDLASLLAKGSNFVNPIPRNPTPEQLYSEWKSAVSAYYDPITSLAFVQINAYSPADSLLIANTLMSLSEDLVNKIANRANEDAVKFAEHEVVRARARVTDSAQLMKEYRNNDQVIDPSSSVVAANTTLATGLRQNVVALQTQVDSLLGQNFTPTSPTVKNISAQLKAAKAELKRVEQEVKTSRDGNNAISSVVGRYETLDLNRQYANLAYSNAMLALDQTRANAAAQHIYLTPYSQPILPLTSNGPKVFQSTILSFLGIFFTWMILLMIFRSVRDARV